MDDKWEVATDDVILDEGLETVLVLLLTQSCPIEFVPPLVLDVVMELTINELVNGIVIGEVSSVSSL